jgi:hypothetical protein
VLRVLAVVTRRHVPDFMQDNFFLAVNLIGQRVRRALSS